MKKIVFHFIIGICIVGCSKSNALEDNFINTNTDHWVFYSQKNPQNVTYWRFSKDKTSEMLFKDAKGKLEPFQRTLDSDMEPNKWQVSPDSTFIWGNDKCKILTSNKNVIVILGVEKETNKKFHFFFIKEIN